MRGKRGFALVITLIVTALLVAITVEFIHEVYVETSLRHSYADAQQASLLASAGVSGAVKLIETTLTGQNYTSLNDPWAGPLQIEDETGKLYVTVTEESGKLDLNSMVFPNGTLNETYCGIARRLFSGLGLPTDALAAVSDWIDSDDAPRNMGAETPFYREKENPYAAKNAPLESYEELRMVAGFDHKILLKLNPYVTVYSESGGAPYAKINVNTAPAELLAALDEGMNAQLAARLVEYRRATPLEAPGDMVSVPGFETLGMALRDRVTVKGTVFRIQSRAEVNGTVRLIESVIRASGAQSTTLYWREL